MTPMRKVVAVTLAFLVAVVSATFAQDAPPPPPPDPADAQAPVAPPALSEEAAAALQQSKDSFKTGAWAEALAAAVTVLQSQATHLEALYIAGTSERQLNQLTEAEGHLKTLVEVQPLFPLSHFQLAYVLFLEAEGFTRAGQTQPAKAKYIESAAEFGQELGRDPTHAASLSSRSIALAHGGQIDESAQAHEAWISATPQKNDPVVSLSAIYAGAGRSTEAMATLDRIPDKSPKAVFDATLAVANVFIVRRDWSAAVPFLEKAADADPTSTQARALVAESCARAGLTNDAVRHLQKLLTMDPTPAEAEGVGEAIKASMGDGKSAPAIPGIEPPAVLRIPTPRYPTGPDRTVETEVRVLTLVRQDGAVVETLLVPNRIWKDIRTSGFEAAALAAVKRGKFVAGTKGGEPAELWIVVSVKFTK